MMMAGAEKFGDSRWWFSSALLMFFLLARIETEKGISSPGIQTQVNE
jgi:hypothetical protein